MSWPHISPSPCIKNSGNNGPSTSTVGPLKMTLTRFYRPSKYTAMPDSHAAKHPSAVRTETPEGIGTIAWHRAKQRLSGGSFWVH